jgi:hypothetical protein
VDSGGMMKIQRLMNIVLGITDGKMNAHVSMHASSAISNIGHNEDLVYTAQVTGRKIFMIKNKQVFIIGEY